MSVSHCGSVVAGNALLTRNLQCHGDAITLVRGTLDLNHHTIFGNGTGIAVTLGDSSSGSASVSARVVNGAITGFAQGFTISSGQDVSLALSKLTIADMGSVLDGTNIKSTSFDHVTVHDVTGAAITVTSPNSVSLHDTTITRADEALLLVDDGQATISASSLDSNRVGVYCSQGLVSVDHSDISSNTTGMSLFECEGSTVSTSTLLNNGDAGIDVSDAYTFIADPTLTLSRDRLEGNAVGLRLSNRTMSVVVSDSRFSRNVDGITMATCDAEGDCPPVADTFTGDSFAWNSHDGINWGYGTVTAGDDTFDNNGDWGFYAAAGTTVVDGGGNVTRGTGGCHGLTCS